MVESQQETWNGVQDEIDRCTACFRDGLLERIDPSPARPWPPDPGRILFLSEAPPPAGGFWNHKVRDKLREAVLPLLAQQDLRPPDDVHSREALEAFVKADFFLLQTLKWPLAQRARRKRPNFPQLGPAQQRQLVDHAVSAHLSTEMRLVRARAIMALGTAAWHALVKLAGGVGADLPRGGIEEIHGGEYWITLAHGRVPLGVTFLPVPQNLRDAERAAAIRTDVGRFLVRIRWQLPDEAKR